MRASTQAARGGVGRRVRTAILVVAALSAACALGQQAAREGAAPAAGPVAVDDGPPKAYVMSFRVVFITPTPECDPRLLYEFVEGAMRDGAVVPKDAEGFYSILALDELYRLGRDDLQVAVGPVYSVSMPANADYVGYTGVCRDGERSWGISARVEPVTQDGLTAKLWMKLDMANFEGSGTAADAGQIWLDDVVLEVPRILTQETNTSEAGPKGPGKQFSKASVLLVMLQEALP
ncbi:MAG TPA: hypothetical protein PLD23_22870 [Armatimonadota bacterium]|nr:hypothetical protein [Armatimonadota bacterium]HQK96358.1 hypothetical protein [Armatimonadota bacterium]